MSEVPLIPHLAMTGTPGKSLPTVFQGLHASTEFRILSLQALLANEKYCTVDLLLLVCSNCEVENSSAFVLFSGARTSNPPGRI